MTGESGESLKVQNRAPSGNPCPAAGSNAEIESDADGAAVGSALGVALGDGEAVTVAVTVAVGAASSPPPPHPASTSAALIAPTTNVELRTPSVFKAATFLPS